MTLARPEDIRRNPYESNRSRLVRLDTNLDGRIDTVYPSTIKLRDQLYDVRLDHSRHIPRGIDNCYTLTGREGDEIKARVRMTPNSRMISASSVSGNIDPRFMSNMRHRLKRMWHGLFDEYDMYDFYPYYNDSPRRMHNYNYPPLRY